MEDISTHNQQRTWIQNTERLVCSPPYEYTIFLSIDRLMDMQIIFSLVYYK